jgi:hypothetical protein
MPEFAKGQHRTRNLAQQSMFVAACDPGCDIPPKVDLRARLPAAADGPQWPASPTPFIAYSNGPGLAELLRL